MNIKKTWFGWILFGAIMMGGATIGLAPNITIPVADAIAEAASDAVEFDD